MPNACMDVRRGTRSVVYKSRILQQLENYNTYIYNPLNQLISTAILFDIPHPTLNMPQTGLGVTLVLPPSPKKTSTSTSSTKSTVPSTSSSSDTKKTTLFSRLFHKDKNPYQNIVG